MKLKTLLLAMLVAGIATSLAIASPPADKGREGTGGTTTTTETQGKPGQKHENERRREGRPKTLLLHGAFVSASDGSFAMLVKRSNKHGRALRGTQATVLVDNKTKFRRLGKAELSDLVAGDRLTVLVRARKNADGSALELLARLVNARPAKAQREDKRREANGDDSKTGSTRTDTTTVAD